MSKITIEQMRSMRYGIHSVGSHVHVKLRYDAYVVDLMRQHSAVKRLENDITYVTNKSRTHTHVAGVFHQNSDIVYTITKVAKEAKAYADAQKAQGLVDPDYAAQLREEQREL